MKVKKFIAPTMPEVMMKVRKDLGVDAVILNSKVIHQGGFLGFFKKKNIEVIAALDPKPDIGKKRDKPLEFSNETPPLVETKYTDGNKEVIKEVKELRKWIEKNSESNSSSKLPMPYQQLYDSLIDQEVSKNLAAELVKSIQPMSSDEEQNTKPISELKSLLKMEIGKRLEHNHFSGVDYSKRFVHLVGPTGVGKTTTIAKIAANCVLKDNKKVALITTDTYRIAAIEQLKTYAKILDVPLEIAYSIDDYKKARDKFKDYDIVLVDTAGRNFRDPKYVKELGKVVDFDQDLVTLLVLSLTTRSSDLEEIMQQFKTIPINHLIFTKKDETKTYGAILNLCLKNNVGVAYITDGQNVPDDIKEVTAKLLTQMIVGEKSDE